MQSLQGRHFCFYLILMIVPHGAWAASVLSWERPDMDESGNDISGKAIEYNIYISRENQNQFKKLIDVQNTEFLIENAVPGCWDVYVTAFFADEPNNESEPSNAITVCIGLNGIPLSHNDQSEPEPVVEPLAAPVALFIQLEER